MGMIYSVSKIRSFPLLPPLLHHVLGDFRNFHVPRGNIPLRNVQVRIQQVFFGGRLGIVVVLGFVFQRIGLGGWFVLGQDGSQIPVPEIGGARPQRRDKESHAGPGHVGTARLVGALVELGGNVPEKDGRADGGHGQDHREHRVRAEGLYPHIPSDDHEDLSALVGHVQIVRAAVVFFDGKGGNVSVKAVNGKAESNPGNRAEGDDGSTRPLRIIGYQKVGCDRQDGYYHPCDGDHQLEEIPKGQRRDLRAGAQKQYIRVIERHDEFRCGMFLLLCVVCCALNFGLVLYAHWLGLSSILFCGAVRFVLCRCLFLMLVPNLCSCFTNGTDLLTR